MEYIPIYGVDIAVLALCLQQPLQPVPVLTQGNKTQKPNRGEDSNGNNGQHFGDAPWMTNALQSSTIQTPAPEPAPAPAPSSTLPNLILNPEAVADDEGGREECMESNVADTIVKHMAEQLYQFKGCLEHEHCEEVQEHQLRYASAKHRDIRQLTRHLQGVANKDATATPLPDILSKPTLMRRGSIPNCDFEQIFEGRIKGGAQSVPSTSVESVVEISVMLMGWEVECRAPQGWFY